MKKILKRMVWCLLLVGMPDAMAEGLSSMTDVTAANCKVLAHHTLEVECRSQKGTTYLELKVFPDEDSPLLACDVVLFGEDVKERLLEFAPKIDPVRNRDGSLTGSRVAFHISDEMIDRIRIRYHLHANENQSHVFTIRLGHLRAISKPNSP